MLAKFETKSSRVKGVSFHPTRPWILCSLHDGQIQLWDYRVGTLLETFQEHEGPVRSVDFHPSQPLFVSGGDDYKIRVWNYRQKRCLFALLGHLDYIRTVCFHPECPWILSASDDQNIRIWNWQSRECLTVLAGHNHYVMSAQFHPKEDLVISASLDQTIRVWDISGLRQSRTKAPGQLPQPSGVIGRLGSEILGVVKYVLEGHERGVNWASFHPELPLIVSGSDDRQIKIWRYNEIKAWEIDNLRGHTNNVSCVIFHPKEDLIISDSEDHSIRVWDGTKRIALQTFMRAHDRFWIITAHKTQNLLAAGHDTGAVVFKLRRERPPLVVNNNQCFYVKDRYYRIRDFGDNNRDTALFPVTRGPASINTAPRTMCYNTLNTSQNNVLIHTQADGGSYELLVFSLDNNNKQQPDIRSGVAKSVCFTTRNRFITLEDDNTILIKNLENQVTKRVTLPLSGVQSVYFGGCSGRVLLKTDEHMVLYDYSSGQILGDLTVSNVKRISWDKKCTRVAIVCKQGITIANKDLKSVCNVTDPLRIKDAIWDDRGALLYSTLSQVKYLLPSGEQGIVRSLDEPIYLVTIKGNSLFAFNRDNNVCKLEIDPTEYLFKLALEQNHYREAIRIIKDQKVDGQAIVSYLQRRGFEDIALHFVQEPRARFNLAIRCGNLEIALECAHILDETEIWNTLATEALRQGNHQIVEMAYQKTKAFEKLSFLYLITGNMDKLRKMLKIAEMRGDIMSRFHNCLYLGDVEGRINILKEVGQYTLAYITASTYGITEEAEMLKNKLIEDGLPVPELNPNAELLMPPVPLTQEGNWPLLETPKSTFDRVMEEEEKGIPEEDVENEFKKAKEEEGTGWSDDDMGIEDEFQVEGEEQNGWGDDLDLDMGDTDIPVETKHEDTQDSIPKYGNNSSQKWCQDSSLAHDHASAGSIDTVVQLLNRQIGVVNFEPLQESILGAYTSVHATLPGFPGLSSLSTPLYRFSNDSTSLPLSVFRVEHLTQLMKVGHRLFQAGKFEETLSAFRHLILAIPMMVVDTKEEEAALKDMLENSREYITAVLIEFARRESKSDVPRSLALSYYMTHCQLLPAHLLLALNLAMVAAFKVENYIDAARFANRILSNPEINNPKNASLEQKARKVLIRSEKEGRNTVTVSYEPDKHFVIHGSDLIPLYDSENMLKCPYCGSCYVEKDKNSLCNICTLSQVGAETLGLVTISPHH
ncbi:hypothetical protein WA158_002948 [Blastocystis sp. Blastoise]